MVSIKEIESLPRDTEGRIILDNLRKGIDYEEVDEEKGRRHKNWITFRDGRILKKTIKENTYEDYAELIVEEICDKIGMETAHYDIAIEDGVCYVLSWDFVKHDSETLISGRHFLSYNLETMIEMGQYKRIKEKDQKELNNLKFIEMALGNYLSPLELEDEMKKFDMLFALNCFTLNGDVHLSNWSLIHSKETKSYRLSSNYDSGSAFRSNLSQKKLQMHTRNLFRNKNPEIIRKILEGSMFGESYLRRNTLNYSYENTDELGMTRLEEAFKEEPERFLPCLIKLYNVDFYEILENVETRIGRWLPDPVLDSVLLITENNKMRIEKMISEVYGNMDCLKGDEAWKK